MKRTVLSLLIALAGCFAATQAPQAPSGYLTVSATTQPDGTITAVYAPIPVVVEPTTQVSPPTQPSTQPALTRYVAPFLGAKTPSQMQFYGSSDVNLHDVHVEGFANNLTIAIGTRANVKLSNVRSINGWNGVGTGVTNPDAHAGQGIYAENVTGSMTATDCLFAGNGMPQRGLASDGSGPQLYPLYPYVPYVYVHGWYLQVGSAPLVASEIITSSNANGGVQIRNGGTITNWVSVSDGNPLLVVDSGTMGTHLHHVTIYQPHGVFNGAAWASSAIYTNYPVDCDDVWICGAVGGQTIPQWARTRGDKVTKDPAINAGGKPGPNGHPWTPPPAGQLVRAHNGCRIQGWDGPVIGGYPLPGNTSANAAEWQIVAKPLPNLLPQLIAIQRQVLQEKIDVPTGRQWMDDLIRKSARRANGETLSPADAAELDKLLAIN